MLFPPEQIAEVAIEASRIKEEKKATTKSKP
jgi:hypothetical protein